MSKKSPMFSLIYLLFFVSSISFSQIVTNQEAVGVLGQPDFTTKESGTSANQLKGPNGVAVDPTSGKVFVVDRSNNRVLRWSSSNAMINNSEAEAVFGQTDFVTGTSGLAADKFNNPIGIQIDNAGRMWIGDFSNNRVLRFDNASEISTGASADGVLGQTDFVTSETAAAVNKLAGPVGVSVDDDGNLWVSEFNNHRVTMFLDAGSKANGGDADLVLGQPDFVTKVSGLDEATLNLPNSAFIDKNGNLWVSDYGNKRFLMFKNAAGKTNGAVADLVLGQADFTSNTSSVTAGGTGTTRFVWGDSYGTIYCVQESNNRILVYEDGANKTNGADADYVLGQPDFVSSAATAPPTASSLNVPRAITVDNVNGFLWVADYLNNRVLRYKLEKQLHLENGLAAVSVLGQPNFTEKTSGTDISLLKGPNGIAVDPLTGKVFVVDRSNNRILRWTSETALQSGSAAEAVLGQVDFVTGTSGLAADKFNNPIGAYVDKEGKLWVGDFSNNRVLRFDNASEILTGASADGVLGQLDFVSGSGGTSEFLMAGPVGVHVDEAGNLWVSEFSNNRVTKWNKAAQKVNGGSADGVLGQPDFVTKTSGLNSTTMNLPNGVFVDYDGRLWVSDYGNKRFLRYDGAFFKTNGAEADGVLGQPDFDSNTDATTSSGTGTTRFIWGDLEGRIYAVQESNNRILVYEAGAFKANGADADYVLGQAEFTTKNADAPPTASSLNVPRAVYINNSNGNLWVADYLNNRVLRYNLMSGGTTSSIKVVSPNGGEEWGKGTVKNITWTSNGINDVMIEYSIDNGNNWDSLTTLSASLGEYEWTVPDVTTDSALVRISDISNSAIFDVSDNLFSIGDIQYSVTVISPNGYQQWEAETNKKILFESKNLTKLVIEYSSNNGTSWNNITDTADAVLGEYTWTLPADLGDEYLIKITGVDNAVTDISDVTFSIVTPKYENNQDYVFFSDSPTDDIYDASWGFANAPSTLEFYNTKVPVTPKYSLVGNYSLKLNWKSAEGGNWGMAIAGIGWVGRDVTAKDTMVINIFSEADFDSTQMPLIYIEDLSNNKSEKIGLQKYVTDIHANMWNKVIIPLQWFKDNPGGADLTRIKTIFFAQNNADNTQNTWYIDDIRMTGGEIISGEFRPLIVVLGSSTAAGTGASSTDSSWVGRYRNYIQALDTSAYLVNLAVGGYTSYDVMPSDFTPPAGRPSPKTENNITKALTYKPWAIIINLPSNDANMGYSIEEQVFNMKYISNTAAEGEIPVWVTTTQPRNFSETQRANLIEMRDSILNIFDDHAINVFTPLSNTDGTILAEYNSGDGIHLNDAGHKIIFDKVVDAQVWEFITTDVEDIINTVPSNFALNQNYPNPFNPSTTIEFALPTSAKVDVRIYDILGREVATLASGNYASGYYRFTWNASELSSGMYICRINANGNNKSNFVKSMKMMLLK